MLNQMMNRVLRHIVGKNFTNPFLAAHMPPSLSDAIQAAERGEVELNPPVPIPPDFRGRIGYEKKKCIGCKLCIKVCPANAIDNLPEEKKVEVHVDRCCFCSQCVDVCPVSCLWMSDQAFNSSCERHGEMVKDSGSKPSPREKEVPYVGPSYIPPEPVDQEIS